MNATASTRSHALARTLLLGLTAGLSLGAQAGEARHASAATRAVVVSYADLDLSGAAGAQTLYVRLKAAAEKACGPEPSVRDLAATMQYRACYDRALNKAVDRVGSQRLQALHAERAGHARVG